MKDETTVATTDDLREALIQAIGHHFCGAGSGPEIDALGQSMAEAVVDDALKELATYFEQEDVVELAAAAHWNATASLHRWACVGQDTKERWRHDIRAALRAAIGVEK